MAWYPPLATQTLGLGWTGPYLVTRKLSDVNYQIQRGEHSHPVVVHVDQPKPYEGTRLLYQIEERNLDDIIELESETVNIDKGGPQTSTTIPVDWSKG